MRVWVVLFGLVCSVQADVVMTQAFNENADGVLLESNGGNADCSGPESGFSAAPKGASIRLSDTSREGNPAAMATVPLNYPELPLKISFDCRLERLNAENVAFELRGFSEKGLLLTMWSWDGSGISYHDGSKHQTLREVPLDKQVWYHFEMIVPPVGSLEKSFSFTVADPSGSVVLQCSDLEFRNEIFSYESVKWFYNNGVKARGSEFYIDNVLIQTASVPSSS